MKVLYLDCFSGISGDMTVGALADLGVKPSTFEWELAKLDIGDFHMHFERKQTQSIEGIKFGIHEGATHTHGQDEEEHDHGHSHEGHHHHEHGEHSHESEHSHEHHEHGSHCEHGHEGHEHHHHEHAEHTHSHEGHEHHHDHEHCEHAHGRTHAEIRALIEKSDLSDFVKKHTLSIFQRIAVAEGKIHGVPPEAVAFHEVGALDSIADIVLACVGIEQLKVGKIFVSALSEGRGWIECQHGKFPIPAPATLEILSGIPLRQEDEEFEFITPTGAAIAAEFGASFGPMPAMKVEKIGYGVGSRKLPGRPNALRAILGETDEKSAAYETDTITRIETNIDDLSPEITGATMDKLLAAGALDVFFTSIQMKKNRPAIQLTLLCENADVPKLADIIFAETTSFGIRMNQVNRLKLERKFEKVKTEHGEITVKLGLKAGRIIQVAPEYESVRAASEKTGASLRTIYESARKAASI
ncbi:MAG TPA: nickel pincer cofactor biosynthesis protein LarC [Chthoniobacteraceae bacterium]|nr:nickel pincer cofactor biosynthesis protein LarC [Chthoniobacteraceae bacterium]